MVAGAIGIVGSDIFSGATNEGLQIGETSIKKPNNGDAVLTVQETLAHHLSIVLKLL